MYGLSRDAQLQATRETQAAGIKYFYIIWCDGNHQWPAMAELYSQNSVFLREVECHCQVAEFLLQKYKIMNKSKFRASNTLLNSAEYAILRKEHFFLFPCLNILPGHSNSDVP
jgi:hypothetical protein